MQNHPSWSYTTNIYEVNVRQYTPEGTFNTFSKHLPRLKDMGVEILWFMPITLISQKDRKGSLGSYYAVHDYTAVNPEFGTLEDFKELVSSAHKLGFEVIIDWVANHAGNDNVWIEQHPDFFCYENGGIVHPNGWDDVSKLNYDNPEMQIAMIDAMKFWVNETGIDGFRCDMAHLVRLDFWKEARKELDKIDPDLFWLAECEEPFYHEVFDATYTWKWMHKTEEFVKGKASVSDLTDLLIEYEKSFPSNAFRVYFTSNHDENSWNGTEYEKYGSAAKAFAVFSCTWNGIPMIYNGQELPNYKRLKFFDKDPIDWRDCHLHDFYKTLLKLRKTNPALTTGINSLTRKLATRNDDKIFAFLRKNNDDEVLVVLNLSNEFLKVEFQDLIEGEFKNIFDSSEMNNQIEMNPWDYKVYEKLDKIM